MASADNTKMGQFIRELREKRNMTQLDLARILNTTQSAIARMEKGEQNFTTEMLHRISKIFNRPLVKVAPQSLDFRIEGGHTLSGEVTTNTSKNGAMGLLCAALLNEGKTTLHGIPRLEEVSRIMEVLESIGVSAKWVGDKSLEIKPPKVLDLKSINSISAQKTRTIIMFLGPLIHLFPEFILPNAGGCKLGKRTIAAHIFGMEKLGAKIEVTDNTYEVQRGDLHADEVVMYESGDTATENIIMLAAKIPGKTVIKFASPNYMVQDVCFFLEKLGVKIDGIGTTTLVVHGVKSINQSVEYYNTEDPIESMMFLSTAIVTQSNITIKRCPIDFLELELLKLEKMGFIYTRSEKYKSKNERTDLVDIETFPSKLVALDEKLYARPYPGLNIDNLPFFVPIATQAEGRTLIHDWIYENRAIYYMELVRLGAGMILADTHRVYIDGPTKLKAAQVVCPPALRPGMIIMIAMLAAEGTSILRNVYSIARGYEEIAERLNKLGAKIEVLNEGV
jgi:UDP-N-acetylglucosamine 1-carboxyvinyltransferase